MSTLTHIGPGITVVGTLRAGEDLTIAGRVRGRIEAEGAVIVEAGAIVEADVRARDLVVRGVVIGDIAVVETLEVTANGQVLGNITGRRLQLRAGGRISGEVSTGVELQGFVYPDRVASTGTRRTTTSSSRPVTSSHTSRPTVDAGLGSRGPGLREGARSWLSESAPAAAPVLDETRFKPHFEVGVAEEAKPEPSGDGA